MGKIYNKKCINCGKEFIAKRSHAKYCCGTCGEKDRRERLKSETRIDYCENCGLEFQLPKSSDMKYCSTKCKSQAIIRKRKGIKHDPPVEIGTKYYVMQVRKIYKKEKTNSDWKLLIGKNPFDALKINGYKDRLDEAVYLPANEYEFYNKKKAEKFLENIKKDADHIKNLYPELKKKIDEKGEKWLLDNSWNYLQPSIKRICGLRNMDAQRHLRRAYQVYLNDHGFLEKID